MAKYISFLFMAIFSFCSSMVTSTFISSANISTTWVNNDDSLPQITHFIDGSAARFILVKEVDHDPNFQYPGFGYGFLCKNAVTDSCYLGIFIVEMWNGTILDCGTPQIVWSAYRDNPVSENATLKLSHDGDMILADANGTKVWSSGTSGKSIVGISIKENGNLLLFNQTNGTEWQSFDHPTDTLLVGQTLRREQRLTSSISSTNLSAGLFYFCIDSSSVAAFVEGGMPTPIQYLRFTPNMQRSLWQLRYLTVNEENVSFNFINPGGLVKESIFRTYKPIQFLRLDVDGGPRLYCWDLVQGVGVVSTLSNVQNECQFPLKCGRYGVCKDGQCSCPRVDGVDYFVAPNGSSPNHGCQQAMPLKSSPNDYQLVDFGNLSYFSYFDSEAALLGMDEEDCKQACSRSSSCAAAFFLYDSHQSIGYCYMPTEILTIIGDPPPNNWYYSSSYIKVQTPVPLYAPLPASSSKKLPTLLSIATVAAILAITIMCSVYLWKRKGYQLKEKDHYLKRVPETPRRLCYSELCNATMKFTKKLGGGGFGDVFKGVLRDGTVVAVKRLDKTGQGTKEFLAEVETLGNIHHINLVKLIGFCAEKSHRLLVYEYMSNGSLDKWIFEKSQTLALDWNMRQKIILDIAKGLTYIHEECRQRVAHLDVKPQNILLDDNFNAKLSDFGLSKLIDRDQSQVITSVRGTLGYLAPEWQHSRITVKADIYSFGIVLLEIVTGRKIFDYSRPESDVHLLSLLEKKTFENRLIDIVHYQSEDVLHHEEEIVKMMRLGLWCLNFDHTKRPPMSTVVKVLEGVMELEPNICYKLSHFLSPLTCSTVSGCPSSEACLLSTPR